WWATLTLRPPVPLEGFARSHHVVDCEASSVIVVIIFAVAVGHSGRGSASLRSPWRAKKDFFCSICGGLRLHGDRHDWFLFHWSRPGQWQERRLHQAPARGQPGGTFRRHPVLRRSAGSGPCVQHRSGDSEGRPMGALQRRRLAAGICSHRPVCMHQAGQE
ncbi:unnamed protein product, partial [Ixodes persulcatus]